MATFERIVSRLGLGASIALTTLASFGALSAFDSPAAAAGDPPKNQDLEKTRTALYNEGIKLGEAGQWAEAVDRFRRVIAIRSAPKALFTLGQAEEKSGLLASAQRSYEKARADGVAAGDHAVVELASEKLRAIGARVPSVTLTLDPSSPRDAHATVDGQPASFGIRVSLDPGDHEIYAEAPGATPFKRTMHFDEGQTADVAVVLAINAAAPPPPTPDPPPPPPRDTVAPPPPRSSGALVGPIVLVAVGVGAGVTGFVVENGGQSDYDRAAAKCTAGACTDHESVTKGNDARTRIIAGNITMVGGGAFVLGGVAWFVLSRVVGGSEPRSGDGAPIVAPMIVRSGAGAAATLTF